MGNLIGCIAAEPVKAQRQNMLRDPYAKPEETFRVPSMAMIELSKIPPDQLLVVVKAAGICNPAVRLPHKPLRVLARQRRVYGAMVDYQVNHHLQAGGAGLLDRLSHLLLRRGIARGIQ